MGYSYYYAIFDLVNEGITVIIIDCFPFTSTTNKLLMKEMNAINESNEIDEVIWFHRN